MIPDRCVCGHNLARHELPGFDGECVAEGCRCLQYFQDATITSPAAPDPAPAPERKQLPLNTVEQVVTAAREIDDARIRAAVTAVEHIVTELRHRVFAERNRLAAHEARMAAGGKLTGAPMKRTGLGSHRLRAHGVQAGGKAS